MTDQTLESEHTALLKLAQINEHLATAVTLTDRLAAVLPDILEICRADRGRFLLVDPETGDLKEVVVASSLDLEKENQPEKLPSGLMPLAYQAVSEGRILIGYSRENDSADSDLVMLVTVPLAIAGHVKAVLSMESRQPDAYPTQAFEFLDALKTPLIMAIEVEGSKALISQEAEARSAYISLVTHQLRVPLTSISGYADMVASGLAGPLTEKQETFLRTIRRNVERMNELIRTLGEINRIDSGRQRFKLAEFLLDQMIAEVVGEMEETFSQRDQQLQTSIDPDLPLVFGDREATARILRHLLQNASQYGADNSLIRISVELQDQMATVSVKDEGIGISPADSQQIFSLFFRSEEAAVRKHIGWGLGLAISKRLVEGQGGKLTFDSEYGSGTTFRFTIPLASPGTK